ncbi:DUF1304 domain-containing protein [Agrobacterium tumefaciens]|uniref:DUF1304 domain-containing protein n=1 Tax=Agrobacterium tumefaciens TaxID=358 RepID=UPI00287C88EB|nr:DUF1304 domain-containing protein [Agrobacterium tumefaciens]MDS7595641.1 DUF1304 domain-containing protein [Agrobacterium tumefaciens]
MLANILIAIVIAIHLYIVVLEMLLWEKPAGRKAFGLSADFARQTRVLAANQGLYNGFLTAGLLYGLYLGDEGISFRVFFLVCVTIAGIFGAVTASTKILFVQALPAILALGAIAFSWIGL